MSSADGGNGSPPVHEEPVAIEESIEEPAAFELQRHRRRRIRHRRPARPRWHGRRVRARHPVIGKRAAIKVLKPSLSNNPATIERFLQEARSVNQIGHPNIVDIFDVRHAARWAAVTW